MLIQDNYYRADFHDEIFTAINLGNQFEFLFLIYFSLSATQFGLVQNLISA